MNDKPRCADCDEQIPQKRVNAIAFDAFGKPTGKVPRYCITCQEKQERRGPIRVSVSEFALAACGECDDTTRAIESGYGHISEVRRPRIHLAP